MFFKFWRVVFCSAVFCSISLADEFDSGTFQCPQEKLGEASAKELLEKIQSKYSALPALSAKFVQRSFLSALDMSESSSGEVQYVKPAQLRWHYKEPEEQIFLVKQDTIWFYQPLDKQVTIDSFSSFLISDLPTSFLMGLGNLLQDFKIDAACEKPDDYLFYLKPKTDKAGQLSGFRLLVDKQQLLPSGAWIKDSSDNVTRIVLGELVSTNSINPKLFEVTFPAETDIIDRRK